MSASAPNRHHSVTQKRPGNPRFFLYYNAAKSARAPEDFTAARDGQPGPLPIRHLPFPGPKFPCPTRLSSRTVAATAASKTGVPPAAGTQGEGRGDFPPFPLPALRLGTGRAPHWLRLRRAV